MPVCRQNQNYLDFVDHILLPLQSFNGFQRHHHRWMEWFGTTIGFNRFSMVFESANHWFRWFSMVVHHWSSDGMVTYHRWSLGWDTKQSATMTWCTSFNEWFDTTVWGEEACHFNAFHSTTCEHCIESRWPHTTWPPSPPSSDSALFPPVGPPPQIQRSKAQTYIQDLFKCCQSLQIQFVFSNITMTVRWKSFTMQVWNLKC